MDGSPKRRKVGRDDLISASPLVIPSSCELERLPSLQYRLVLLETL